MSKQHWQGKKTDFLSGINKRQTLKSKRHLQEKKTDFLSVINERQTLKSKRHWQGKNKELQKRENVKLEVKNMMVTWKM